MQGPVDLGGIEEGHPKIDRLTQRSRAIISALSANASASPRASLAVAARLVRKSRNYLAQ